MSAKEFTIACNNATDKVFRDGALCHIIGGENGDGYENRQFQGLNHQGRVITKWSAVKHFNNFRPKWINPKLKIDDRSGDGFLTWTREDAQSMSDRLNKVKTVPEEGGEGV